MDSDSIENPIRGPVPVVPLNHHHLRNTVLKQKCVIALSVALSCLALLCKLNSERLNATAEVTLTKFGDSDIGRDISVSGTSGHAYTIQRTSEYKHTYQQGREEFLRGPAHTYDLDPQARICDVWAVITTINPPTRTVQQLAGLPHVCLCVVGDRKTPPDFHLLNVTYLSPRAQAKLPYKTAKLLPWNHFGRKTLGYLYAIHHGAKVIYDTDDDNELIVEASLPYLTVETADVARYATLQKQPEGSHNATKTRAVNVYALFGAEQAWPRGFPLDEIRNSAHRVGARSAASHATGELHRLPARIAVIQSLANHDPDVDAIYRLSTLRLPFDFSQNVGDGLTALAYKDLLCPYNAQATLHFAQAFWGLVLPITVHGRVSDIWRSYFTQRLIWELREPSLLAFAPPWVTQQRNPHSYLADFQAEAHLYERASALLEFLTDVWECKAEPGGQRSLSACLLQLYINLYERDILGIEDVELMSAWIEDLQAVGYQFPDVTSPTLEKNVDEKHNVASEEAVGAQSVEQHQTDHSFEVVSLTWLQQSQQTPLETGIVENPSDVVSVTGYMEEDLASANLHPQLKEALSFRSLPTLKLGRTTTQQLTSHEGNADLDNFLYQLEGSNALVLLDMEGPGCLHRAFLYHAGSKAKIMLRVDGHAVIDGDLDTVFRSGFGGHLPKPFLIFHSDDTGLDMSYPLCFNQSALLTLTFDRSKGIQEYSNCIGRGTMCPNSAYMDVVAEKWTEAPAGWWGDAEDNDWAKVLPSAPPASWAASWEDYVSFTNTLQRIRSSHAGPGLKEVALEAGITVEPKGGYISLLDVQGAAGAVRAVIVKVSTADWDKLWWEMRWDQDDIEEGQAETIPQVWAPFNRLHNSWNVGETPFLGYRLGAWEEGGVVTAYVFHPMPFSRRASVRIVNRHDRAAPVGVAATLLYTISQDGGQPSSDSYIPGSVGHYFVRWVEKPWGPCFHELLSLHDQTGHVVAHSWRLFGNRLQWVENDPVVYIDDARTPKLWFSGLEDEVGGAHGFAYQKTYSGPAYGWHYDQHRDDRLNRIGAYVNAMADPHRFMKSYVYGIQGHNRLKDDRKLDYTFHYYAVPNPSLRLTDEIDMGDPTSLARHRYEESSGEIANLTSAVNGQWYFYVSGWTAQLCTGSLHNCPEARSELVTRRGSVLRTGSVTWDAVLDISNQGIVLRRLIDLWYTPQRARVYIDGEEVGLWVSTDHGTDYAPSRFADNTDFIVPARFTRGKSRITISLTVEPRDPAHVASRRRDYAHIKGFAWTAFHYWVYSMVIPGQ